MLFKKKVTDDPLCPICSLEVETVGHALWHCPSARDVWTECSGSIHKCSFDSPDFMSIMDQLLKRLKAEDIPFVVNVARQIWHRRNSVVFGGDFAHPKTVVNIAIDQVEAFVKAEEMLTTKRQRATTTCVRPWEKPPVGFVKLNWDASVDRKGKKMGIGLIVRDHAGGVVAMACETKDHIQDPAVAEAIAARRGVELSGELGIRRLLLEGDALQIVQAISSDVGVWVPYGVIIEDTMQMLQRFQEHDVMHIQREANQAAHHLAKLALTLGVNRVWREDFPESLHDIVTAETSID